jgi:hypothetical protein
MESGERYAMHQAPRALGMESSGWLREEMRNKMGAKWPRLVVNGEEVCTGYRMLVKESGEPSAIRQAPRALGLDSSGWFGDKPGA